MTRNLGTIEAGFVGTPFALPPPPQPADEQVNVFRLAHRLLRGRYLLAVALGATGCIGGAALGYFAQKPKYQSEGFVRIAQTMTPLVRDTYETATIPNMTSFVNTHATYLKQPRLVEKAIGSVAWMSLERPGGPQALKDFRDSLVVTTTPANNELISVVFSDKDPRAAKIGLEELLTAYEDLYADGETRRKRGERLRLWEETRRNLTTQLQDLRSRQQEESTVFGTDDLGKILDQRNQEQIRLDAEVHRLQALLDERLHRTPQPDALPADGQADGRAGLTADEIAAAGDTEMRKLMDDRAALSAYVNNLRTTFTQEHREVKRASKALATLDAEIEKYVQAWNKGEKRAIPRFAGPAPETMTTGQLQERLAATRKQAEQWRAETAPMAQKRIALDVLRRDIQDTDTKLQEARRQIEGINSEAKAQEATGKRIEVIRPTEIPSFPSTDRRKKFALVGFVLGGGFPIVMVALLGLLDGRLRYTYSDQTSESSGANLPLLGTLPLLPDDLSDPEQSAAVALSVHQMRTLLQIGGEKRRIYAVTSATAGDGKTSLVLSLGLSFAASGSRTLLIDFDLIGHGLTSSLKIRQDQGIGDALQSGQRATSAVVATGIERLWLIPAGSDDEKFVSRLSEPMVRRLLDGVRAEYDIILIDTGPILGSLEANFVTAAADGVVLVIGRGQQRAHVQRAIEQLTRLGARVLGMVFNRADAADFMRSATSASFRSVRDEPAPAPTVEAQRAAELEPIARTVAMDLRR